MPHINDMRKAFTLLFILVTCTVYSQKNQKTGKPMKKDNVLIDLHYSSLINRPPNVHFDFGYGLSFQLLYDYQFKVKQLSGALGLAYSTDHYYNNAYLSNYDSVNGDYTQFYPFSDLDSNVKLNKYVTNYFDIPFE